MMFFISKRRLMILKLIWIYALNKDRPFKNYEFKIFTTVRDSFSLKAFESYLF